MQILFLVLALFQFPNNYNEKAFSYHTKMADKYYHVGDFPNMIYHLQEKIKFDPKDCNTYSDIAYYYWSLSVDNIVRRKEFMDKAFYYLKIGLENNKDSAYMYDEIGNFYITTSKNYILAVPFLEKSISKKDAPMSSFHSLSNAYIKNNKINDAIKILEMCVKKFPYDLKAKSKLDELKKTVNGG